MFSVLFKSKVYNFWYTFSFSRCVIILLLLLFGSFGRYCILFHRLNRAQNKVFAVVFLRVHFTNIDCSCVHQNSLSILYDMNIYIYILIFDWESAQIDAANST